MGLAGSTCQTCFDNLFSSLSQQNPFSVKCGRIRLSPNETEEEGRAAAVAVEEEEEEAKVGATKSCQMERRKGGRREGRKEGRSVINCCMEAATTEQSGCEKEREGAGEIRKVVMA